MIKCIDNGMWTCIRRDGTPKKSYTNQDSAINAAKLVNEKDPKENTKLVAYKCANCIGYHLTTKFKK